MKKLPLFFLMAMILILRINTPQASAAGQVDKSTAEDGISIETQSDEDNADHFQALERKFHAKELVDTINQYHAMKNVPLGKSIIFSGSITKVIPTTDGSYEYTLKCFEPFVGEYEVPMTFRHKFTREELFNEYGVDGDISVIGILVEKVSMGDRYHPYVQPKLKALAIISRGTAKVPENITPVPVKRTILDEKAIKTFELAHKTNANVKLAHQANPYETFASQCASEESPNQCRKRLGYQ